MRIGPNKLKGLKEMRILDNMKKVAVAAAFGIAIAGSIDAAQAVPISGTINITGAVSDPTDTDHVTFTGADALGNFDVAGDFSGLAGLVPTLTNIDFTGALGQVWSVGGFTFSLTSIITAPVVNVNGTGINFLARGLLTSTDPLLDDTKGVFDFSSNSLGSLASFSSTTAVPLPGALLLFGSGLAGLGYVARRRQLKSATNEDMAAA